MAFYADEDSVWKCADHPSKRRRIGVCPVCLREKLAVLCSDCAMARPCACSSSASSSSSSSISLISFPGDAAFSRSVGGGRSVSRVSNFADSDPEFRRSRSVAVSIFRSVRLSGAGSENRRDPATESDGKGRPWLWLFFWPRRSKKAAEGAERGEFEVRRVSRSRSVAESARSVKSKAWYFPSPMKVFRYSKGSSAKNVRERSSSLHGG